MGKKQKQKKKQAPKVKPQIDWLDLLEREMQLPMDRLFERDVYQKTLWQVIADSGLVPIDRLDLFRDQVMAHSNFQSSMDALIPTTDHSALGLAIKNSCLESILALLHMGASIEKSFADGHWMHALFRYFSDADEVLTVLSLCEDQCIALPPEVQFFRDADGFTLHDYALIKFSSDVLVTWLLEHQLFPHGLIQDTPVIMWLIKHGKRHLVVDYLLCISSRLVYDFAADGSNILSLACAQGDLSLVEDLLLYCSDGAIHRVNHRGENALHVLARVRTFTDDHHAIFQLLLMSEMDVKAINHDGDSVLMMALRCHQNAILPTILMLSDIYQINRTGEHCLSIALCCGLHDMVKVIINLNRRNGFKPFDLEYQLAPLPQEIRDRCYQFYGSSFELNLRQKFLPLSIAILGYRMLFKQSLDILGVMLNRKQPHIRCDDNPYATAMAVNEPGFVRLLLKYNVPGSEGQKVKSFLAKASSQALQKKQPSDPYLDYIGQVDACLDQGKTTDALDKARLINLDLFPIRWAVLPEFQDHYLLMCLEAPYLDVTFHSLHQLLSTHHLSGYVVLDEIVCDVDGQMIGQRFSGALRTLMLRCEQNKITDRCSSDQKEQLKKLGFVLTGHPTTVLNFPTDIARGLGRLIPAFPLVFGGSLEYRRAMSYWRSFLLDHFKYDEDANNLGHLSLMALFLKCLESFVINPNIRANADKPSYMFNFLTLMNRSSKVHARNTAVQMFRDQLDKNRQFADVQRQGLIKTVLGSVLSKNTETPNAFGDSLDGLLSEVANRPLSDRETLRVAYHIIESLRATDKSFTESSRLFFDYYLCMIISPCGYWDGIDYLQTWLVDSSECHAWLSYSTNRAKLMKYFNKRFHEGDDPQHIWAVMDMVLPHYMGDTVDFIFDESIDVHKNKYNQSHEVLVFLSCPEVRLLLKKHAPQLYHGINHYMAFSMVYSCRRAKVGYDQSLDDFQRSSQISLESNVAEMQVKLESMQTQHLILQSNYAQLGDDFTAEKNRGLEQEAKVVELDKACQKHMEKIGCLQNDVEGAEGRLQKEQHAVFMLRENHDQSEKEHAETQQKHQALQSQYDAAQMKNSKDKHQMSQKIHALEESVVKLERQCSESDRNAQNSNHLLKEANQVIENLKLRVAHQAQSLIDAEEARSKQTDQMTKLQDELKESLRACNRLAEDLETKSSEIGRLRSELVPRSDDAAFPHDDFDYTDSGVLTQPNKNMFISAIAIPVQTAEVSQSWTQTPNYVMGASLFRPGGDMPTQGHELLLSKIMPQSFNGLFRAISKIREAFVQLPAQRKKTSLILTGSLALFLARQDHTALNLWFDLARKKHEDIDFDVHTSCSIEEVQRVIEKTWSGVKIEKLGDVGRRLLIQHSTVPFKFDLHVNPHRKPYPDALFWYWDTNRSEWIFNMNRLLPSQHEFLWSQPLVSRDENMHVYLNFSFFWALIQCVKHKFYGQNESVCIERLRLHCINKHDRTDFAKYVCDVLEHFEGSPFWDCALQVVLGHMMIVDIRGNAVTPMSYLLPYGGNKCFSLCPDVSEIHDMNDLRTRVRDVYAAEEALLSLETFHGPFDWSVAKCSAVLA